MSSSLGILESFSPSLKDSRKGVNNEVLINIY